METHLKMLTFYQLNSPPLSSVAHELAAELEQSIQLSVIDLEEQLESVTDEKSRLSDIVEQHKRVGESEGIVVPF